MKRPTMADIAQRAGVTKGAVSFALNGRPGVSEATRERILGIARELGWQASAAARALSDGRAGAFGLVVDRPARMLGVEPFFMQLVSGMQAELAKKGISLLFTLAVDTAEQVDIYRKWWASRQVDGVFLVDAQPDDPRMSALEQLGLPAVVIGAPEVAGNLSAVWSDDAAAVRAALDCLAGLGHRRVARVAGPNRFWHTRVRTESFEAVARAYGMRSIVVEADYSAEQGAEATRTLLGLPDPPTAVLYDNDVMAMAGLSTAMRTGVRVPEQVSLIAWDDSPLCELVHPGLTALWRDIPDYGAKAAHRLVELTGGGERGHLQVVGVRLVVRGSTGPAPDRPAVRRTAAR
ncbi:LacI family transcriptional regulator [Kitasatospora sp. NE20-6]|uniref:LacI family DNA-binding transcriptional regulator n=1 Tax=Kitasatospora sp. NE20-6 TaxID=2859066 RepID=UPI0034DBA0DB